MRIKKNVALDFLLVCFRAIITERIRVMGAIMNRI